MTTEMSDEIAAMPEIVRELVESNGSFNVHVTASNEEVLALLRVTEPDVVQKAHTTIIMAKQAKLLSTGTLEKDDRPSADTED